MKAWYLDWITKGGINMKVLKVVIAHALLFSLALAISDLTHSANGNIVDGKENEISWSDIGSCEPARSRKLVEIRQ